MKPTEAISKPRAPQWHNTLRPSNSRLFATAVALSVTPLWFGDYMPMVDLPQHAAQIGALIELRRGNPMFAEVFTTNWFTPYLLGYALFYLLSEIFPIAIAAKILISGALVGVSLATSALLKETGADIRWRWLAIPGAFSFAFYWGFLSFIVAVPLALILLIAAIRFDRKPDLKRGLSLAALSVALFFCHVIALGYISIVACGFFLARHRANIVTIVVRCLPIAAPIPLIVAWALLTYDSEVLVRQAPVLFGSLVVRLQLLLIQPAGLDRLSLASVVITAFILLLPVVAGSRPSRNPERWAPFVIGLILFLVTPRSVFHTAYIYPRLGVFLVPLWLIAWDPPGGRVNRVDTIGMLVILVWLAMNVGRFAAFARDTQAFDKILKRMEPGQTAASLVVNSGSSLFGAPVNMHIPAWYQAKKAGIVDFNFADAYAPVVRYKANRGPRLTERIVWAPLELDWAEHGGYRYRYFVVKAPVNLSYHLFAGQPEPIILVARYNDWWLYENRRAARPQVTAMDTNEH